MCARAVSLSSGVRILPETLPSLEWSRKEHPLSLAPQSRVGQAGGFVRDQKKRAAGSGCIRVSLGLTAPR